MKSSLSKEQLLAGVGGGLLLLVGGGLGWMGLGSLGQKQAEAQALAERMGNPALAALLADPGGAGRAGRDSAELEKLDQELREKEGAVLQKWAEATRKAGGEGQTWAKDPGKWKDELILVQSDLQSRTQTNGVKLGPEFYLGLEAYRQKSPTVEEVPGLATHLAVAKKLVELLYEAHRLTNQRDTKSELRSLVGPGTPTDKIPQEAAVAAPAKPGQPPAGPKRKSFFLEVACSPEVLYEYVRLLTQDDWLFILNDLTLENAQQYFPLRSEIAKKFAAPEAAAGAATGDKKEKKLLEILAGEESVAAVMRVDFVIWENPEAVKAAAAAAPAP